MQKIERAAIAAYEKDLVNSNRPIDQLSSSSNKPSTSYQNEIKESNDNLRQEALGKLIEYFHFKNFLLNTFLFKYH